MKISQRITCAAGVAAALVLGPWSNSEAATPDGLTLNAHRVVVSSSLPHCANEDGSGGPLPCTWNVGPGDGNGEGLAYWIGRRHHVHYVWSPSPLVNHPRWQWVYPELGDALAESGHPYAATRNWEACAVKFRIGSDPVKCPDGLHFRL